MTTTTKQQRSTRASEPATGRPDDLKSLFSTLTDQARLWFHQEVELAKAEITRTAKDAARNTVKGAVGIGMLALGSAILIFAVVAGISVLLTYAGLSLPLALFVGALLVGGAVGGTGWILFIKAKQQLSAEHLKPKRTVDTLIETKNWAQSKIQ